MFGRLRRAATPAAQKAVLLLAAFASALGWIMPASAGTAAGETARDGEAVVTAQEMRLEAIGYRLSVANANRCALPEMLTGLSLHDAAAYDAAVRPMLARSLGLESGFGVRRVLPGSSGERAGLLSGDEIVALNGNDLAGFAPELIAQAASPDRTEHFTDGLSEALGKGPATLAVRRGDAVLTVILHGEAGCGGRFVAVPGNQVNAWADGRYVAVTARMLRYAADDQELAFVVAHEMSHNILGHTAPDAKVRGKTAEAEADALAVELLARAGFDLGAPERFLRRSSGLPGLRLNLGHPGNRERIRIVDSSLARIEHATLAAAATRCLLAEGRPAQAPGICGSGEPESSVQAASPTATGGDSGDASLASASLPDAPAGADVAA